ncbi:MAG: hypothetical protein ABSF69_00695 [Polyangiaceae bacterium]|jgi:hypothetical protein
MPDDPDKSVTFAVPGVVQVSPLSAGKSAVRIGPSAGWLEPSGLSHWENELSFVVRGDLTATVARALRATLPVEQIAPKRFPMAHQAVEVSPLLPIAGNLVASVRGEGIRVHTVGVDRVSSGFYYFAEGGPDDAVRVQGNLVEMLAPSLTASSSNAEISALVDGLIDRLLVQLSGGIASELDVELANALPRLSRDGTGLLGTDLDAFDAKARALAAGSQRWASSGLPLAQAIADAVRLGQTFARVPLYGEARLESPTSLDVLVGGRVQRLPGRPLWTVKGTPREEGATGVEAPAEPHALADSEARSPALDGVRAESTATATARSESAVGASARTETEPPGYAKATLPVEPRAAALKTASVEPRIVPAPIVTVTAAPASPEPERSVAPVAAIEPETPLAHTPATGPSDLSPLATTPLPGGPEPRLPGPEQPSPRAKEAEGPSSPVAAPSRPLATSGGEPRESPLPAAAIAPTPSAVPRAGRGIGAVIMLLLAVIAYFVGRLMRRHFTKLP